MKYKGTAILGSGVLVAAAAFAATGFASSTGDDPRPVTANATVVADPVDPRGGELPEGMCFADLKRDVAPKVPSGVRLTGSVMASYAGDATEEQARSALAGVAAGDVTCESPGELDVHDMEELEAELGELEIEPGGLTEDAVVIGGPDGPGIALSGAPAGSAFANLEADDLGVDPPPGVHVFGFVDALYEDPSDADAAKAAVEAVAGTEAEVQDFADGPGLLIGDLTGCPEEPEDEASSEDASDAR